MAIEEKRKKIRRTCYRLLGVPHTAPIGGWKSARERPLFQKKSQGIAEKACWRRRWHVLNRTMEWNFAFTLVFCRGGHWRMMIVERGCQIHGSRKLLEARYSQLKLFQVHGWWHRCPDPCFTEARMELAQQLTGRWWRTGMNFQSFWSQRVWQVKGKYHERVSLNAETLEITKNCDWERIWWQEYHWYWNHLEMNERCAVCARSLKMKSYH